MARAPSDPVEAEIDELFGVSADRFVAERDALVKRLRAQGDGDAAERVRRLRRPSVAAWALNQVARRHPDDVAELVALGEELRRAQRRALSGVGSEDLRRLGTRRRHTVETLSRLATQILTDAGRPPSASLHQAIASTLDAAALSPDDAASFRSGRLERDLVPESGFGAVEGFTMVAPAAPAEPRARASSARSRSTRDDEEARARRRDAARAKVEEASDTERRVREAEQHAAAASEEAARAASDAVARVEELEHALRDARSDLDRSRQASREAGRDLERARRATMQAVRNLDAARSALEHAEENA